MPPLGFSPAPGQLPLGHRVYAIGDVHGCFDQLEIIHARIAADLIERPAPETSLIHLGDYVDRGENSAHVLELLSSGSLPPTTRHIELMGNHEAMMLDALRGRSNRHISAWLANGGRETLASYELDEAASPKVWRAGIPERHRLWLIQRDLTVSIGNYCFVHAGIRPGIAMSDQLEDDLLWIREPFLSDTEARPEIVVHGHTPTSAPEIQVNRIGIDTGAALGGCLTCVVLEGNELSFLSA